MGLLELVIIVLGLAWLFGLLSGVGGSLVHLLLIIVLILLIVRVVSGVRLR